MSRSVPRLRVFAGPNGSGKSTLLAALPPPLVGTYINTDEIELVKYESGQGLSRQRKSG